MNVWELEILQNGHVNIFSAGAGIRREKEGYMGDMWRRNLDVNEEYEGEKFHTAYSPAAANLYCALEWIGKRGEKIVAVLPAGTSFPSGTFWVITEPITEVVKSKRHKHKREQKVEMLGHICDQGCL